MLVCKSSKKDVYKRQISAVVTGINAVINALNGLSFDLPDIFLSLIHIWLVSMTRFGKTSSQLIIEKGIRHLCHYETGYGSISLGVAACLLYTSMRYCFNGHRTN